MVGIIFAVCRNVPVAVLEDVEDRVLVDQEVGETEAVDLQALLVIPLQGALNLFAVDENEYQGCSGVHLLEVVEVFRMGLEGRRHFLLGDLFCGRVGNIGHRRFDQLPHMFLPNLDGPSSGSGYSF